jgi:5'-nucleotidase
LILAARWANNTPSIHVTRKKDGSKDSDFKDAAQVCLPLINAALSDIEKGTFLSGCLLNIGVPSSPSANKVIFLMMLWIFS